jgi:iron complex outermembrane receptor protein
MTNGLNSYKKLSDIASMRQKFAFLILLSVASSLLGQPMGRIEGTVTDAETGEPLAGANVQVSKTLLGAAADERGRFIIRRVPPGMYMLNVTFIGYRTEHLRIRVQRDSTSSIQIALRPSAVAFEQVIVTGSRQQEDLHAAANSVSVVGAPEIRRRNRFRIDEALQSVASVSLVGENVNVRGGSGYSLLGLGGSRVLLLIDDVPVLTSDLGRANWDILPVTEVERVEVLKGAASVLYGSGGVTGVVNVITKQPTSSPSFSFRQSAGLYDDPSVPEWRWTDRRLYYTRTDASFSNTFHRLGLRLAVSRHQSTSDRENGDFERWYISGKAVHRFPDASNLSLALAYNRDERGFFLQWQDQNHALNTDFHDRINVDGFAAALIYNKLFSPKFSTKLRMSYNSQLIGLPFNLTQDFEPALGLGAEWQVNWLPHEDHGLVFGVDYKREDVESKYYGSHQGNAISPYLQDKWQVSSIWEINAGLRYDTYILVGDSAETQLSPKLGASYNFLPGAILHFSAGRGFRAPSIAERFAVSQPGDNVQLHSNPDLKPERSNLFDFGIRQRLGDHLSADVTAFWNEFYDLIEIVQISDLQLELQFRNCPRARVQGLETEIKARGWANRLSLEAALSWMDSRSLADDRLCDLKKNQPLPYRPRFSAFISPSLTIGPATLEADYRYASRYEHVSFYPRDERVPQKALDLRLLYRWQQLTLQLSVKNAVNYNYAPVERALGEIRNFSLSLYGEF